MGLLDGITGGLGGMVGGMIPGMEVLGVVSKGIELAKSLFDKGDVQGTQDMLKFLNDILSKMSGQQQSGQASEPQPFSNPQGGWSANQLAGGASAGNGAPPQATMDITINITGGSTSAQPQSFGTLPIVDGSAQQDQNISNQAAPRIDGSDANKNRALTAPSAEWQQVMGAMQQNPNICYNADTQRFTLRMSDGSSRDVCSLQDAQKVGYSRSNPSAVGALGNFITQKANEALNSPASAIAGAVGGSAGNAASNHVSLDGLNQQIDELKKKLQLLQEAQQMMKPGSLDITAHITA